MAGIPDTLGGAAIPIKAGGGNMADRYWRCAGPLPECGTGCGQQDALLGVVPLGVNARRV